MGFEHYKPELMKLLLPREVAEGCCFLNLNPNAVYGAIFCMGGHILFFLIVDKQSWKLYQVELVGMTNLIFLNLINDGPSDQRIVLNVLGVY